MHYYPRASVELDTSRIRERERRYRKVSSSIICFFSLLLEALITLFDYHFFELITCSNR